LCRAIQTDLSPEAETAISVRLRAWREEIIMQVKVEQLEDVKFAIHAGGHTVICDQPAENGGSDEGMTPPELMLASLGSCAAFYAVQYLKTRNLGAGGVDVVVDAEKLKNPARLGNFRIEVDCPVELTEEQQVGMVRAVHSCLIHNTLMSVPEIAIELKVPVLVG
jgi:putative redox protein